MAGFLHGLDTLDRVDVATSVATDRGFGRFDGRNRDWTTPVDRRRLSVEVAAFVFAVCFN
jgi:hypothetical protein